MVASPELRILEPTEFQDDIPETMIQNVCFSNLRQFNAVFNHQDKLLNVFLFNANATSVTVTEEESLSLPVDDYYPSLNISKIESLTFIREILVEKLNYFKANYTAT